MVCVVLGRRRWLRFRAATTRRLAAWHWSASAAVVWPEARGVVGRCRQRLRREPSRAATPGRGTAVTGKAQRGECGGSGESEKGSAIARFEEGRARGGSAIAGF